MSLGEMPFLIITPLLRKEKAAVCLSLRCPLPRSGLRQIQAYWFRCCFNFAEIDNTTCRSL